MMNTDEKVSDKQNTANRILKAGAAVMVAHSCLKVLSPVQNFLIAHFCDDVTRDLFVFAFDGVLGMLFLIGEESIAPAFLPVFMEEKNTRGEKDAWNFANSVIFLQFFLILAAAALVYTMPEKTVSLLTKWREGKTNPLYLELAPEYARYFILGLFGMSLGSTTYMLLNGYKRFFLAAFGDALVKIGIVTTLTVAYATKTEMHGTTALWVFSTGVWIGTMLKLLGHLFGLRDKISLFRIRTNFRNPAFKKFMLLITPLLIGIVYAKFRDNYVNIRSLSDLGPGLMSASNFGKKIFESFRFLVPFAISIAMLPFFCEMVDRNEKQKFGETITASTRLLLLLCVPLAALLVSLSMPMARLLYQHGKFDFESCRIAAVSNACYSLVLPFAALEAVFMQAFFANRRMTSTTLIGIVFSTVTIGLTYIAIEVFKLEGSHAVAAAALAFTSGRALKTITLGGLMRSFIPAFPLRETIIYLLRMITIGGTTGLTTWGMRMAYESVITIPQKIPTGVGYSFIVMRIAPEIILAGLTGAITAFLLSRIFCPTEVSQVKDWIIEKINHRKAGNV